MVTMERRVMPSGWRGPWALGGSGPRSVKAWRMRAAFAHSRGMVCGNQPSAPTRFAALLKGMPAVVVILWRFAPKPLLGGFTAGGALSVAVVLLVRVRWREERVRVRERRREVVERAEEEEEGVEWREWVSASASWVWEGAWEGLESVASVMMVLVGGGVSRYRDIGCAGYCSASSDLLQVFACLLCLIERIGNSLNLTVLMSMIYTFFVSSTHLT
ncbi:hypothetical protein BDP67DRAFT_524877 [Colletotrichum lupini]|nr:hypothetical protein BDP67DRAFT_524877 [Colletotrichum lupini]